MIFFPFKKETIVSSFSAEEVTRRLELITSSPALSKENLKPNTTFIGQISSGQFRISLRVNRPENFLPLIKGFIDATSMGCIISLHYGLFFSSQLFLAFWTAVCSLVAVFFYFIADQTTYSIIAICAGAFNYIFTTLYFLRKVDESHKELLKALKMRG